MDTTITRYAGKSAVNAGSQCEADESDEMTDADWKELNDLVDAMAMFTRRIKRDTAADAKVRDPLTLDASEAREKAEEQLYGEFQ